MIEITIQKIYEGLELKSSADLVATHAETIVNLLGFASQSVGGGLKIWRVTEDGEPTETVKAKFGDNLIVIRER